MKGVYIIFKKTRSKKKEIERLSTKHPSIVNSEKNKLAGEQVDNEEKALEKYRKNDFKTDNYKESFSKSLTEKLRQDQKPVGTYGEALGNKFQSLAKRAPVKISSLDIIKAANGAEPFAALDFNAREKSPQASETKTPQKKEASDKQLSADKNFFQEESLRKLNLTEKNVLRTPNSKEEEELHSRFMKEMLENLAKIHKMDYEEVLNFACEQSEKDMTSFQALHAKLTKLEKKKAMADSLISQTGEPSRSASALQSCGKELRETVPLKMEHLR